MRTLLLIFAVTFASLAAHASDQLKPVFLKTNCILKSGSVILSAFKEELQNSKKYELARIIHEDISSAQSLVRSGL
jgi:hypothetical protein